MSARREKRLRQLERKVSKLEAMAAAGYLESNLREELARHSKENIDGFWHRTPTIKDTKDTEHKQLLHRTIRQRVKDFFHRR